MGEKWPSLSLLLLSSFPFSQFFPLNIYPLLLRGPFGKSIRGTKNIVVYCTVVVTLVLPWKKKKSVYTAQFFFFILYFEFWHKGRGWGGIVQLVRHRLFLVEFFVSLKEGYQRWVKVRSLWWRCGGGTTKGLQLAIGTRAGRLVPYPLVCYSKRPIYLSKTMFPKNT